MRVLKFGGTSVGTPKSLLNVKKIAEAIDEPAVVVVSALGGITDRLIATAQMASAADEGWEESYAEIVRRHRDVIDNLVPTDAHEEVEKRVGELLAELHDLCRGLYLIRDLSERTLDLVVSYGERASSIIVSHVVKGAHYMNSLDFIRTEKWFGKNIAATELTEQLLKKAFSDFNEGIVICGGFIARDKDTNDITNLGRGGSDYTAALIAATLNADVLEIWTDVDGFMTGDPRIIPSARVIDCMSFIESMQLCTFGAKVIYPPTIYPVFHKNIPIKILNTFNPSAPGTLITDAVDTSCPAKGVSAMKDMALISVCGISGEDASDINSRIYNALSKIGINVIPATSTFETESFKESLIVSMDSERNAVEALESEFAPELTSKSISGIRTMSELSAIAIVGENIKRDESFAPRIYHTLDRARIPLLARAGAGSDTTIAFAVPARCTKDALNLIHTSFFC